MLRGSGLRQEGWVERGGLAGREGISVRCWRFRSCSVLCFRNACEFEFGVLVSEGRMEVEVMAVCYGLLMSVWVLVTGRHIFVP